MIENGSPGVWAGRAQKEVSSHMSVSSTAFQFKHKIQLKNVAFSCAAVKASKRYQKDIGLYGMK